MPNAGSTSLGGESGEGSGGSDSGSAGEPTTAGAGGEGGMPASCSAGGCVPEMGFCGEKWVTWVCLMPAEDPTFWERALKSGCTDPGSQVPRLCCPTSFMPECL
jgi:hypothetical protein